jgi:hypothetical protein
MNFWKRSVTQPNAQQPYIPPRSDRTRISGLQECNPQSENWAIVD